MKTMVCLLLIIIFGLAGCGAWPQKDKPIVTTSTVDVAVPVACKFEVKKPDDRLSALKTADSVLLKGNALLEEVIGWRIYAAQVDAAQAACTAIIEASKKK